jgi:hypothetical protein
MYENEIKQLKHNIYKICWFMRGGVTSDVLTFDTDMEDFSILHTVIEENIETAKKTGMPLI